ncbi:MAG: Cys-tRNA(Pro) deacylase [Ornithinimicrobium sp.]
MGKKRLTSGTPALHVLQAAGVSFEVRAYDHDPDAPSYGIEAAEALGVAQDRVFKTLVARIDPGDLVVAIVPVSSMLDLKALASACGAKKAEIADPQVAQRSTGYVIGGISPIGQRKALPTVLDESADSCAAILVSGGRRGLDIELSPIDLLSVTGGRYAAISRGR